MDSEVTGSECISNVSYWSVIKLCIIT